MSGKCAGLANILLLSMVCCPALADNLCNGTVSGSVLQALPQPTTVSVVQPASDDANPALAQQFLNGIRAGGLAVVPAGQGNTQIDMTSIVTVRAGAGSGTYKGFGWMSGTQMPSSPGSALAGTTISLSIEATDTSKPALAWIGTVQCIVSTNDPDALAEHLGELVARVLGTSVDQRRI